MNLLDPSKLNVVFLPPITEFRAVDQRKYTLAQSKPTGDLLLTVGYQYDHQLINKQYRDEILAEWIPQMGQYVLCGKIFVSDEDYDKQYAQIRYMIFQREAEKTLAAIVYGDRNLYVNYPWLLDSPIYIHFESNYDEYNKILYFGTPRQYLNSIVETVNT
jgi:hypothetical protein